MTQKSRFTHRLLPVAGVICALGVSATPVMAQTLKFYNWSDYIAEDTIPNYEAQTGTEVIEDVFDSNEVLEAKLLAGHSGYDLVVPTASFMGRQIQAGVFDTLDKSKLPNLRHIDPELLSFLEAVDPGNQYGVPYLWGTTGIGYNVDKVKEVLGDDAPVNSWDLVFKPENMEKLQACGVMFLDSPDELYPLVLNYLGKDPNSRNPSDYALDSEAVEVLKSVRPYVNQFHSSQYISALANGDACVAIGWSGDVIQAQDRAIEADNGINIEYSIPKEGTQVWFDMLAIPKDAQNKDTAHDFINYLLQPEVIADISNYVAYANPNLDAMDLQDEEVRTNEGIYPPAEVKAKMFAQKVRGMRIERLMVRLWSDVKTGR
ncbi:spermidine/putrescine ABC transporter substrate-binding protein PotF [Marinomonas piezotolerans]|uniref:Putrescine-binding periplasmic protein n=1 Tax=Marinomonas piezotolerans TaxID=2213058 RepID=A0A370UB62_9GAMM|nr:extracellular solute-binding protein [Marinomonas piezotolerans]RDL45037.1 spermidine/putrescine ABC transporter substrate-binding protein PotF [Marinomonas piezotolerans]